MELIKKGAEAELYATSYFGSKALLKRRSYKGYRNQRLDSIIRRRRVREEAAALHKAKLAGVRTPVVYKVDVGNAAILMEFIEGSPLKDILGKKGSRVRIWAFPTGENIGKMHKKGIIHGDLTTSNILLHNKNLVFVDFGLSFVSHKIEDKAVDLLVFKKTFMATHPSYSGFWNAIIEGYLKGYGSAGHSVLKQLQRVEARVRYAARKQAI